MKVFVVAFAADGAPAEELALGVERQRERVAGGDLLDELGLERHDLLGSSTRTVVAELLEVVVAARVDEAVVEQEERVIVAGRDLLQSTLLLEELVRHRLRYDLLLDAAETELAICNINNNIKSKCHH